MSTEIQVDDETRAALLLFNERVEAKAAQERGKKRVAKAERAKDEAAAVVRKLGENPDASLEDKAEAENAYKAALEEYNTIKADPTAGETPKKPAAEPAPEPEPAAAETSDEADEEPTETSADEEPADAPAAAVAEASSEEE